MAWVQPHRTIVCPLAEYRRPRGQRIEKMARHLFEVDALDRDRNEYAAFDAMPEGLREWWRDRAARRCIENDRMKDYPRKSR